MKKLLTIILLALSVSVIGQTYSKDLEKSAKIGDVAAQRDLGICYLYGNGKKADFNKAYEWLMKAASSNDGTAQYHLGVMCEKGYIGEVKKYRKFSVDRAIVATYLEIGRETDGYSGDKYIVRLWELAFKNGSKEAYDKLRAYYKNDTPRYAKKWLKELAEDGDIDFQFKYAKILQLEEGDNSEAKKWFKKASDGGHTLAQTEYEKILQYEREVAEEAQRKAREKAQRDSIAAVELARQMAEAEQRRKQDSIDIAEGRKLPRKDQLIRDCKVFSRTTDASYGYEFENSEFFRQLVALCNNDVIAYYGKNRLDDLDKAAYKKSEQYKIDLSNFNRSKNEKMAIVFPLDRDSEPEWEFSANSFSFRANGTRPTDFSNQLGLMEFVFPVNPNLVKSDDHIRCWQTFKCSSIEKLQEIRSIKDYIDVLYIFKPGVSAISRYWTSDVKDYVYLLNPIALYLLNRNTGEVVLDLSKCLRKATMATDKQKIETFAKTKFNKRKGTKHSTPKKEMCFGCGGKGYIERTPIGSLTKVRDRCTNCYGKGYTLEYYY